MLLIKDIYKKYNAKLRPLISEVEGRIEYFEEPLLENIVSEFDSIALSYLCEKPSEKLCHLEQADKYLDISVSQSYQYIIKHLDEKRKVFEKRRKISDYIMIENGRFYNDYIRLKEVAIDNVRKGRKKDDFIALPDYKASYEAYTQIENLISSNMLLNIIPKKHTFFYMLCSWIVSILISVLIGVLIVRLGDGFILELLGNG